MSETLTELRFLIFLLLVFGLTLGLVAKKRIMKFIGGMIFLPSFLAFLWYYVRNFMANLDPLTSLIFALGILGVGIFVVLRLLLGGEYLAQRGGEFYL